VYRAIRAKVGPDFPVILKLNGADKLPLRDGLKTRELVKVALIMEEEGIDAVELSVGHYESGFPMVHGTFRRCLRNMVRGTSSHLPLVRRILMRVFHPVIAVVCNVLWKRREGYNLDYSSSFTKQLKIPVICVGGFRTLRVMEAAIESNQCDAVSAGRPFIADP
jgi:2,4-dienoyl-CoA reductase-like NADH-dependent reductase (Old Yellow Enzyme family)